MIHYDMETMDKNGQCIDMSCTQTWKHDNMDKYCQGQIEDMQVKTTVCIYSKQFKPEMK